MEKTYGQNIFKAIIEGQDDRFLSELQRIKTENAKVNTNDFDYGKVTNKENSSQSQNGGFEAMIKAPWAKWKINNK